VKLKPPRQPKKGRGKMQGRMRVEGGKIRRRGSNTRFESVAEKPPAPHVLARPPDLKQRIEQGVDAAFGTLAPEQDERKKKNALKRRRQGR